MLLIDRVCAVSVLFPHIYSEVEFHEAFKNSAICPACPSLDVVSIVPKEGALCVEKCYVGPRRLLTPSTNTFAEERVMFLRAAPTEVPMALTPLPATTLTTRLRVKKGRTTTGKLLAQGNVMGNLVQGHVWRCRPSSSLEAGDSMLSSRAVQKLSLVSETNTGLDKGAWVSSWGGHQSPGDSNSGSLGFRHC